MDRLVVLSVGDSHHLQFGKDRIIYAGMPSEDVYSIVQRKRESHIRDLLGTCSIPKGEAKSS